MNTRNKTNWYLGWLITGLLLFALFPTPVLGQESAIDIIAYGDSLVEGLDVSNAESFPGQLDRLVGDEYDIINRGQTGAETEILLNNLQTQVLDSNPDMVILFAGGADLIPDFDNDGRVPADETFSNLEEIINQLQAEDIRVVLLGHGSYDIPGFTLVDYTDEFEELANDTGVYFVPDATGDITLDPKYTNPDLIHPNPRGYSFITRKMFPVFQEAVYEEFPDAPLSGSCQVDIPSQKERSELVFADEEDAVTDQEINWEAFVIGGYGNYDYEWELETDTDTGNETQFGKKVSIEYEEDGDKSASYEVTSESDDMENTATETIQCSQTIDVETAPVGGKCEVEMRIDSVDDEVDVEWSVDAVGGTKEYEYEWTRNNSQSTGSNDRQFRQTFDRDNTGVKSATVAIDSGSKDAELTCGVEIPEENASNDDDPALESASCNLRGYDYEIGDTVEWNADVDPFYRETDDGKRIATTTVEWSGTDNLSTTSNPARIAYETVGTKEGRVEVDAATGEDMFLECEMEIVPDTDGETRGGGCFIATAAYGTEMAQDLDILRDVRDNVLMQNWAGRTFVDIYYTVSPPVADVIADSGLLQSVTRTLLQPVIAGAELAVR
jgi:lysophospholipase L1-like esterase